MININTQYTPNANPADANYPAGSCKNDTVAGDGSGTPFDNVLFNDLHGALQALVSAAGIAVSGNAETAIASDVLDAIQSLPTVGVTGHTGTSRKQRLTDPSLRIIEQNFLTQTIDTWVSFGPTGSGADVIWTDLDLMPSNAKEVILNLDITLQQETPASVIYNLTVWACQDGLESFDQIFKIFENQNPGQGASRIDDDQAITLTVPLDSQQRFNMFWTSSNTYSTQNISTAYAGYLD